MFLASSNLTRQYWLGQLWYFSEPEDAPNVRHAAAMTPMDVGISAIASIRTESCKVIVALDSGELMYLHDCVVPVV